MEQLFLSPDIAVKRTEKIQSVTANTAENNEENFDPLLEEAVNSQNEINKSQQKTVSSTEGEPKKNPEPSVSSDNLDPAQQSQVASQLSTIQEGSQNILSKTPVPVDALQLNTSAQNNTASISVIKDNAEATLSSTTSQSGDAGKAETILLQQIQQIIDEGKNIGAITIKGSKVSEATTREQSTNLQGLSPMVLNDTEQETIQVRQTDTLQIFSDKQKTSGPKNVTANSENNRQEINEQFLNAKFGEAKNDGEQQAANQHDKQKSNDNQQKLNGIGATIASPPTVGETEMNELGFTQQLRATDLSTSNTPIEGKFAPGAHQVAIPERELVDNLIQRFNVNPRLQTSKLTMQLHPAELGQIKIDILVKGDSISANIVANSQQVMETMEKNVHRLRAVLEDQGFTIDAFQIVMDDNGGKQSELFQEQFNSKQQEYEFTKSSARESESFDNILDLQGDNFGTTLDDNGVNVTI